MTFTGETESGFFKNKKNSMNLTKNQLENDDV